MQLFYAKKRLEQTANIRKIRQFRKLLKMATKERLKPLQNRQFVSKIKDANFLNSSFLLVAIFGNFQNGLIFLI